MKKKGRGREEDKGGRALYMAWRWSVHKRWRTWLNAYESVDRGECCGWTCPLPPACLPVLCGACRPRPSSSRRAIQTITITTNATTTTTTMTRHPTSLLLLLLSLLALSTASTSPPPNPLPQHPQTNKSPKSNPNLLQMHLLHKLNHHRTRPRLRQPPLPPAPLPLPRVPKRKTRRLRLVRPVQPRLLPAEVQPPHLPRRRGQGREHAVLSAG